jgi:hypothetical protein
MAWMLLDRGSVRVSFVVALSALIPELGSFAVR